MIGDLRLYITPLYCTTLHYSTQHNTPLHSTTHHPTPLHSLHYTLTLWDFMMLLIPYVQKDHATPQRIVPVLLLILHGYSCPSVSPFASPVIVCASVHLLASFSSPSSFSYSSAYDIMSKSLMIIT